MSHSSASNGDGGAAKAPGFLAGRGEMAGLIRDFDWSGTQLGEPENWPQSLKTAVRIMLTSSQPIWIGWGEELIYLYNDPYKPIIGGKHPWAVGRPTSEVWHEIWDDIGPMLATAMTGIEGTYVEEQLLIMERNGYPEETYYTFSYSPIPDDDGSAGGIICANTDDTQRVIGERQLALLQELASTCADSRTWTEACERAVTAFGSNPRDLPFAVLYMEADDPECLSLSGVCGLERGHPAAPEVIAVEADTPWPVADVLNTHETILVTDLNVFSPDLLVGAWGKPPAQAAVLPIQPAGETGRTGVLVVGLSPFRLFDDSYERFLSLMAGQAASAIANAQAYEEERKRAEALSELDHAKTLFFSNVSHEFRTPLTLMLGPLEDLTQRQSMEEQDRNELEIVLRNGVRLLKLVNSLLDFSRIEAGRAQASFEPTDLSSATKDLASNFRSVTEKAGLELVVECPPLAEQVFVDRDMWEKIVLNLLSNAFKFTFEGQIRVALSAMDGVARLTVSDSGTGIPPEELPHLFERFRRIEGARGRSFEGSGIGLALVRELVNLHGGEITVESKTGDGTTFTISIPFGTAHLPPDRIQTEPVATSLPVHAQAYVEEALRWLPGPERSSHDVSDEFARVDPDTADPGSAERASIMIVDDNPDMREYLCRLLGARHSLTALEDGATALEELGRKRPDIVLCDVMMPRLDGIGLVQTIRKIPELQDLPVILLSARAGTEARIEGLDAGADDYLVKPFSAREVVARVDATLKMAQMRKQITNLLCENEARFRDMADNAPVMIWTTDPSGNCTYLSRTWYDFTGTPPGTALGTGYLESTHPDERKMFQETFLAAHAERQPCTIEYRLASHDGTYRWVLDTAVPWLDDGGRFLGLIGSVIDIDERKKTEQQRRLLTDELNHRVKNTLAIVQGIAQQTLKDAEIPQETRRSFEARLIALSSAHNLLTRANWEDTSLVELAQQAISVSSPGKNRIFLEGPHVVLQPKQAVTFSLALHELCTNAIKYGSLSSPAGTVTIEWNVHRSAPRLKLTWREAGGPPVTKPTHRGFGTRMVETALAQELEGDVTMDFRSDGLLCTLNATLAVIEVPAR